MCVYIRDKKDGIMRKPTGAAQDGEAVGINFSLAGGYQADGSCHWQMQCATLSLIARLMVRICGGSLRCRGRGAVYSAKPWTGAVVRPPWLYTGAVLGSMMNAPFWSTECARHRLPCGGLVDLDGGASAAVDAEVLPDIIDMVRHRWQLRAKTNTHHAFIPLLTLLEVRRNRMPRVRFVVTTPPLRRWSASYVLIHW